MKRVRYTLATLIASAFIVTAPVIPALAQDTALVAPVVAVADNTPPEWTDFIANLATMLSEFTAVPALAAGVLIFTNAIKVLLAMVKVEVSGSRAVLLALAVQVVVWIIYQLAIKGGFDLQFQQWYDAAATIINALLPLVLTFAATHYAYEYGKKSENPILGYKGYRKASG